jgi:hypothetical protein
MATDKDNAISTLNNLIETCKDGQNGFQAAADGVKNNDLKTLFHTYSRQRAESLHRGWIDIKSAVTGEDENAVISECERGEDSAVRNYEDALREQDLPADVRAIVERQFAQIKEAHDRIRSLERATGAGN